MPKLRHGHAPGHVRDTACEAFEAFINWNGVGPEPTVEFEIGYEPHQISLTKACGLVWQCNDVVPGSLFDYLEDELQSVRRTYGEPVMKRRTYAACAQAIVSYLKERRGFAE